MKMSVMIMLIILMLILIYVFLLHYVSSKNGNKIFINPTYNSNKIPL